MESSHPHRRSISKLGFRFRGWPYVCIHFVDAPVQVERAAAAAREPCWITCRHVVYPLRGALSTPILFSVALDHIAMLAAGCCSSWIWVAHLPCNIWLRFSHLAPCGIPDSCRAAATNSLALPLVS